MRSLAENSIVKYRNDYLRKLINESKLKRQNMQGGYDVDTSKISPLSVKGLKSTDTKSSDFRLKAKSTQREHSLYDRFTNVKIHEGNETFYSCGF